MKRDPNAAEKNVFNSQELVQEELASIARIPGNEFCADCKAKGPRWASVNLGLLVCIECSGIHRGLGTHISVVKSLTLDRWNSTWISVVRGVGNELGRTYWEYNVPEHQSRPTCRDPKSLMEQWIRDKYEKKLYVPGNSFPPQYFVLRGENPYLSLPSYHAKLKKKKYLAKEHVRKPRTSKLNDQISLLEEFGASSPPSMGTKKPTFRSGVATTKETTQKTTDLLQQLSDFENKAGALKKQDITKSTEEKGELFDLEGLNIYAPTHEDVHRAKVDSALVSIDHLFSKDNPFAHNETTFPVISPEEKNPFFRLITSPEPHEIKKNTPFLYTSEVEKKQTTQNNQIKQDTTISDLNFRTGFEDQGLDTRQNTNNHTDFNVDFTQFGATSTDKTSIKDGGVYNFTSIFQTPARQKPNSDFSLLNSCDLINHQGSNKTEFFSADNLL